MKHNNLYSGLVMPSNGWWSPICCIHFHCFSLSLFQTSKVWPTYSLPNQAWPGLVHPTLAKPCQALPNHGNTSLIKGSLGKSSLAEPKSILTRQGCAKSSHVWYLRVTLGACIRGSTWNVPDLGRHLSIGLDRKGLTGTNTIAYYFVSNEGKNSFVQVMYKVKHGKPIFFAMVTKTTHSCIGATTLSITTFSLMTFCITTLGIKG